MIFNFDILPEPQRLLWPKLGQISELGFVLYGGTAAALRFGHRESIDFDFFSSQKFSEAQIIDIFPWLTECRKTQIAENTYAYITNYGANITFLGNFYVGRIGYPDIDDITGIQIASAEDVFALKLRAAHDRVAVKDFIDIVEFIKQGYSLEDAIIGAQTLIKGMPPAAITLQMLMWYDHPVFNNFSEKNRKIIKDACMKIDLNTVTDKTVCLSGTTLQDEEMLNDFRQKSMSL